jgi:hypothetical protein
VIPTADPTVLIEEKRDGYVRYVRDDGVRWEIEGVCDMRGDCLVGAVDPLLGPPETRLDVPVTPEFFGCCPLVGRWLE